MKVTPWSSTVMPVLPKRRYTALEMIRTPIPQKGIENRLNPKGAPVVTAEYVQNPMIPSQMIPKLP